MKKFILSCLLLISTSVCSTAWAIEVTGTVDEMTICLHDSAWRRLLLFKVSDTWFGAYADYYSSSTSSNDRDDNVTASMIMMAYSSNQTMTIKASSVWDSGHTYFSACGISNGYIFHSAKGDYMTIRK